NCVGPWIAHPMRVSRVGIAWRSQSSGPMNARNVETPVSLRSDSRQPDSLSVSVVLPVHNEEGNLRELHRRLTTVLQSIGRPYEMVFVDDGSTDRSTEILRTLYREDPSVTVIELSRNFGHHLAITAGLDHATGDAVVLMDADLQDQPEEIPALLEKL